MLTLYMALFTLLLLALSFLLYACKTTSGFQIREFILTGIIFGSLSIGLYSFSSNQSELRSWLTHGKEHYVLLEEFQQLGGMDGLIEKVKQRLASNPADKQGWLILGKLYEAKHDKLNAQIAFDKARQE